MRRSPVEKRKPAQSADAFQCPQCLDLLEGFADAVDEVITLNKHCDQAVAEHDPDPHRFDGLIDKANERKRNAKSAYTEHIATHAASA